MLTASKVIPLSYRLPRSALALGWAILIELVLLVGLIAILAHPVSPPPKLSAPVALRIVDAIAPPLPVTPAKPLPPRPKSKPTPKPAMMPRRTKPTPLVPAPAVPLTQTPIPTAFTEPVAAPALPPAPPSDPAPVTSSKANLHAAYLDKVRAAVQAAVYYPPIAAAMHYSGRVRVEFHLLDGTPDDIHVATSSNIGILDRAALQAVQAAHYPAPPEDLRGKDQLFQIWVVLTLTNSG
ncbi:MAG: energy transducer TonB [Sulfuriferula sp.]